MRVFTDMPTEIKAQILKLLLESKIQQLQQAQFLKDRQEQLRLQLLDQIIKIYMQIEKSVNNLI